MGKDRCSGRLSAYTRLTVPSAALDTHQTGVIERSRPCWQVTAAVLANLAPGFIPVENIVFSNSNTGIANDRSLIHL